MEHYEKKDLTYPTELNYKEILWDIMKKKISCAQPNWATYSEASFCREYAASLPLRGTFTAFTTLSEASDLSKPLH